MGCYKLAIAISGAVSLGSYEAGVMYEIIKAIGEHNQSLPKDSQERIEIDILTGASAGGLTAAIVAQLLMYDAGRLEGSKTNAMYRAWVEDSDLERMLRFEADDKPGQSLLSSSYVLRLCHRHILTRYHQTRPTPPPVSHPAAAPFIHLGLALSNMNGVDYGLETSGFYKAPGEGDPLQGGRFVFTAHQDRRYFEVSTRTEHDNFDHWFDIGRTAVACGAFPFAFRVQSLLRECRDPAFDGAEQWDELERVYAYLDGGIFDNYPLGMAKAMVNKFDPESHEENKRYYLYISPEPRGTTGNKDFRAGEATYAKTAGALSRAVFWQARYQEWVKTQRKNKLVARFDRIGDILKNKVGRDDQARENLEQFHRLFGPELKATLQSDPELSPCPDRAREAAGSTAPEGWEKNRARLMKEFLPGERTLVREDEGWLDALLLIKYIMGAHEYDFMTVYTITAHSDELAGEKLSSFAGFFDMTFRDFDYQVGRRKAQTFLRGLARSGDRHLPLKPGNLEPVVIEDESLGRAELSQMSRAKRQALLARMYQGYKSLVDSLVRGWFWRWALKCLVGPFFVKSRLQEWLQL